MSPTCSAVLFPLAVTVYVTWWFLTFFDNFFSVSLCGYYVYCCTCMYGFYILKLFLPLDTNAQSPRAPLFILVLFRLGIPDMHDPRGIAVP